VISQEKLFSPPSYFKPFGQKKNDSYTQGFLSPAFAEAMDQTGHDSVIDSGKRVVFMK
jgi:hypothetical protein